MKKCSTCRQAKPCDAFATDRRAKDGKQARCRQCHNEANQRSRKGNREYLDRLSAQRAESRTRLAQIKLERGCADCGYQEHAAALDFDHRPGEVKLFDVASGPARRGWGAIEAEVAKCDVVCANCHRIRTYTRRYSNAA